MNLLKIHLGFIFPLLIVCFCFQFTYLIEQLIRHYEANLNNDYNIVLVSEQNLENVDLKHIEYFSKLTELSPDEILNRLKDNVSAKNISVLKSKLPKFYSISFNKFINDYEVKNIKKQLLKIPNVLKVETFSRTHIKVYKLLVIIKFLSYICLAFVSILSVVLFFKQIRIWRYENEERIYILNLFGANFFQRASKMLSVVFIDNLISMLILCLFFINFNNIPFIVNYFNYLEIDLPNINFLPSLLQVSLSALLASLFCVIMVMFKAKK